MKTQTLAESSKLDNHNNNLSLTETDPDEDEEELNEADDIEEDDDDSLVDEEEAKGRVFSVGEFVWGKIKHHPWWPGQIYDTSDASDLALKHKPKDKNLYLVAYFGDGTFSWCSSAQLKRFDVNFESLSRQSCLKSFEYAVEDALSVISELVVLEMTCGCVEKDGGGVGFVRPVAENAGVRKGVLVPMVGVDGLGVARFDGAEIVAGVRNAARSVSVRNSLEVNVLSSKLLAFYRAKGCRHELARYNFPVFIEGLEDINKRGVDGDAPVDGSVSNEDGQANSSEKAGALREDKLYGRRKRKSLADIIREETDTDVKIDEEEDDDKKTPKRRRRTKIQKPAGAGQNVSDKKDSLSSLVKGRQKAKSSRKTNSYKDAKVESVGKAEITTSVENTDRSDSVEVDVAVKPKGRRRVATTTMSGKKDEAVKSRDKRRKKDSLTLISSIKQAGFEPVLLDLHTDTRVGERMSKAAKLIIESPPFGNQSRNSDPTPTEIHSGVKPATFSPLHERPKLNVSPLKTASDFDTPMDEDDDDGRPMSAILFMTFSSGVSMPSKTDLLAKYSPFGSLNKEETDVVPNTLCAQVVFIKKSDGEQAFEDMVKMNAAESGVQYRIRYVPRGSKIGKLDGSMQPKSSPQSVKVHNDAHPVSVSYLKQKFETIMFKLNNVEEDELPNELKDELRSELTSLVEEIS